MIWGQAIPDTRLAAVEQVHDHKVAEAFSFSGKHGVITNVLGIDGFESDRKLMQQGMTAREVILTISATK